MKELAARDRPISERYRIAGQRYAALNQAATFLEEMKTTRLQQLKTDLVNRTDGGMPENKAERLVKADPTWEAYIKAMCDARGAADELKEELAALRMEYGEWQAKDANARAEYKLGRMGP